MQQRQDAKHTQASRTPRYSAHESRTVAGLISVYLFLYCMCAHSYRSLWSLSRAKTRLLPILLTTNPILCKSPTNARRRGLPLSLSLPHRHSSRRRVRARIAMPVFVSARRTEVGQARAVDAVMRHYHSYRQGTRTAAAITRVLGLHTAFNTSGLVALVSPLRLYSTNRTCRASASRAVVTAEDLRGALRALNLSPDCTDAEIKAAFQTFAKANHPDTFAHLNAPSGGAADATREVGTRKETENRMFAGTQAYQLLRQLTFDDRQRILREHRFRADGGGFEYTEEEYAKAEAAYRGHRRTRASPSMEAETAAFNADFFNPHTHQGRTRTAQFNQFQERVRKDRHRRQTWGMGTASTAAGETVKSTAPGGGGFRLHFFDRTWRELQTIKRAYKETPGFAGMDGSRYDTDANAARAGPELTHNPHLKQYLTMRRRAREKKVLDNAIGGALTAALFFVACFAMAVLTVAGFRKIQVNRRYDEIQKQREEERGGG